MTPTVKLNLDQVVITVAGNTYTRDSLPVDHSWRVIPVKEGMTWPCRSCLLDSRHEKYHHIAANVDYCRLCYHRHMGSSVMLNSLPVSPDKPWYTWGMMNNGWVEANVSERVALVQDLYDNGHRLLFGDVDHKASHPSIIPPDVLLIRRSYALGDVPISSLEAKAYSFDHNGVTKIALLPCAVCGGSKNNGAIQSYTIGSMHSACYTWFTDGPAESLGYQKLGCGCWWAPDAVLEEGVACMDCGRRSKKPSSCRACSPIKRGRCGSCNSLHAQRTMTHLDLSVLRVDPGFDLFAALADFYILSDLLERDHEYVEEMYVQRVMQIARELARCAIMVTGGEARHASGRRAGGRTPSAIFRRFKLSATRAHGREEMWHNYVEAYHRHGVPVLNACVEVFETGSWSSGYGGKNWARAARIVRDFAVGKLTPPQFIDSIFGVQHNGGSLFDKLYMMSPQSGMPIMFGNLLDVRRQCRSSIPLLITATLPVQQLWMEVADRTQDEELLLGKKLFGPYMGLLIREVYAPFTTTLGGTPGNSSRDWQATAKTFRVDGKHRPKETVELGTLQIKKPTKITVS